MKNNQNSSKTEYLLQLKTEYSALKTNDYFESKQLELELKLLNLVPQLSSEEVLGLSEDDRNWIKSFFVSKENGLFSQIPEFNHPLNERLLATASRAIQQIDFFKTLGEQYDKVISNGLCAYCHGTLTPEQINQYHANQSITCEQCNHSMSTQYYCLSMIIMNKR